MRDAKKWRTMMRTTLNIEDDVLASAKAIAGEESRTIGEVVSDLARRGLRRPASPGTRNRFALLPIKDSNVSVTLKLVNALRDNLP